MLGRNELEQRQHGTTGETVKKCSVAAVSTKKFKWNVKA